MIQKAKEKIKNNYILLVIATLFFLMYAALSWVRHYNFQSNAYDLGIFNQTLYNYAHLSLGPNTLRHVDTLFGDHFEPILFLFTPLYYLFGTYTLLVVQVMAIILGGFGVYKLIKEHTGHKNYAIIATTIFFSSFGVFQALAFDYHNNVIGAMAIPWILYYLLKKDYFKYYLIFILCLSCKETMALVGIMIGVSIICFNRKQWQHGLITMSVSVFWFLLTTQVLIPFFNNNSQYDHWQSFSNLGTGPLDALYNAIIDPVSFVFRFVDNNDKIQMWWIIILSGGLFAFFYPRYSIMLLPLLSQKFLAQNSAYWGYYFHYNIELMIIVVIAGSVFISENIANKNLKYFILLSLCIINIGYSFKLEFYDNSKLTKIFTCDYYFNSQQRDLVQAIAMIPVSSDVIAQNHLIPHLANRKNINVLPHFTHSEDKNISNNAYQCPSLVNHEYLILNLADESVWPMTSIEQVKKIIVDGYDHNSDVKTIYNSNNVILYQLSLN